jgi:glutaredoxin 3
MDTKIIVYGAEWCGFCHAARRYLDDRGVKYDYRDVEHDANDMRAAIEKSGQMGIPVIDIGGTIIIGFDRPRIDQTLKDKKLVK